VLSVIEPQAERARAEARARAVRGKRRDTGLSVVMGFLFLEM
jgi:hypothetical protein